VPPHHIGTMGLCMSTNNDDVEQKKRSQAIDRKLEEDSRRLRRECKILLLGITTRNCCIAVCSR
jgi:guanine nucleotide-binding protein subunit alpha